MATRLQLLFPTTWPNLEPGMVSFFVLHGDSRCQSQEDDGVRKKHYLFPTSFHPSSFLLLRGLDVGVVVHVTLTDVVATVTAM